MIEKRFKKLWEQLQGKKIHMPHFLTEICIDGMRGINDLRVLFDYPVSVIAGGNASGKSTVLFAAASAYKVPGAGVKDYVPSTLFPDYRPKVGRLEDDKRPIVIEFNFSTPDGQRAMVWRRAKGWNRSFLGRKNARQPQRKIYLRTLSNLSNPSEVRGVLSMSRLKSAPQETPLTASQIDFSQKILPFQYSEVVDLSDGNKRLLFASHKAGTAYSELHMAAGERSILRLSQEIANLKNALVLIDEVEAGLHPWVQQLLMLQLQQLALRNDLQIIVTSHSPAVLDSVPANGRIFLNRNDDGQVTVQPPYQDIIQDALYGRSKNKLKVLCEDDVAEGILQGVFDVMLPQQGANRDLVQIGKNTGANEFPTHAKAFNKFGQIHDFIFALDGDQSQGELEEKIRANSRIDVPVVFLPGNDAPEVWVWSRLQAGEDDEAAALGMTPTDLLNRVHQLNAVYDSASDTAAEIAKSKLHSLSDGLSKSTTDVCRNVAKLETDKQDSDIQPLVAELQNALLAWRGE